MFEEFEKGTSLKDLVGEILREGPRSISQVGKALKERGLKIHRLAIAGYLKALADEGFLREEEIPPAKVYALKPGPARRDLYVEAASRCREAAGPHAPRLYLQVLSDLFHRPIFHEEFRRGGVEVPREAAEATSDDRQAARRQLSRSPLKLPFNDPAYQPKYPGPEEQERFRQWSQAALAALVRDEFRAGALAVTTRQVTLGGEG